MGLRDVARQLKDFFEVMPVFVLQNITDRGDGRGRGGSTSSPFPDPPAIKLETGLKTGQLQRRQIGRLKKAVSAREHPQDNRVELGCRPDRDKSRPALHLRPSRHEMKPAPCKGHDPGPP